MNNAEKLQLEIEKQVAAGFSGTEIKQNLLNLQYTPAEIEVAMRSQRVSSTAQASQGKTSWVSLLVSIFFIFSGLMKMSKYESGSGLYMFGVFMLLVGIGGAVWKMADLVRK